MNTIISCPGCQNSLNVPSTMGGKKVKCPTCGTIFVAPEAGSSTPASSDPWPAPPPPPQAPLTEDPIPAPRKPNYGSPPPSNPFADVDDQERDRPRRPRGRRSRRDDDDDDYGRGGEPHRGDTIMIMGILSIVLGFPIGLILGLVAINMANTDLTQMAGGGMDRSGKSSTQTGKTCATVGVVLNCIGLVGCCGCVGLQILAAGAGAGGGGF
jgi:LSD1 subclass zinc finger protein